MIASSTKSKVKSPPKSKRGGAGGSNGTAKTTDCAAKKRRKRNLERNRAAAAKCRQRKKQWQDGLERKKLELENRYKALFSEREDLIEEVAQLKNFIMVHAACNDANIDDWVCNEAISFVRRMNTANLHEGSVNNASAAASLRPFSAAAGLMAPTQSVTRTDVPVNVDTFSSVFPPFGSEAPFDTSASNNPLRASAADDDDVYNNGNTNNNSELFNQDALVISLMEG